MKQTLLQMTQSILSDMDSEAVNSISDTVEAQQIASVIEDTFYNISSARDIPEHHQLLNLLLCQLQLNQLTFNTQQTQKKLSV